MSQHIITFQKPEQNKLICIVIHFVRKLVLFYVFTSCLFSSRGNSSLLVEHHHILRFHFSALVFCLQPKADVSLIWVVQFRIMYTMLSGFVVCLFVFAVFYSMLLYLMYYNAVNTQKQLIKQIWFHLMLVGIQSQLITHMMTLVGLMRRAMPSTKTV